MCGRCIGSFSIHAYARAALLPPYHAWLNGAHAKRNDRFLAQVYLMPRVEEGGAPYLACVAPHATASAADDMVYNLASACKRPGRASYLGNSKVDFCRSFIFPPRTAKLYIRDVVGLLLLSLGRVAGPEELRATKLVEVALCRLSFASLC